MMGIDVAKQRDMMEEGLEAILRLLEGETVTMETDWFTLRDARLQLLPYTRPRMEVAVAAQVSPAGPTGGRPLRLLAAVDRRDHPGRLRPARRALGRDGGASAQFGTPIDRQDWRLVARCTSPRPRSRPTRTCEFGLAEWVDYFQRVAALPLAPGERRRRACWPTT